MWPAWLKRTVPVAGSAPPQRPSRVPDGLRVYAIGDIHGRFDLLQQDQVAELHQFATDGDAVEAHSARHLRAPDYVTEHGLQAYLDNEALPSINNLVSAGFHPTSYAYPFGARSDELDAGLLQLPHVERLRSIDFVVGGMVSSPCRN